MNPLHAAPVLVIGAGIMGAGIAQVAALAGHRVMLYDTRPGAAGNALTKMRAGLDGLVAKGRLDADAAAQTLARIEPVQALGPACSAARLVVEAIVENLDAKRALFRDLEAAVGADCVLASNTSSLSITAIANGLKHPQRLVGMHFFNPVPQMKLVEVVSGLRTSSDVAAAIFELSNAWGKVPVHARSTPGFIVNRIARPYYAEALALLLERAATPAVLDACLRGAGFRMGPCELMDLIGHDTNFAVTQAVFEANFFDKRYTPSLVQREMVDGGLLGRKSGQGFYAYPAPTPTAAAPAQAAPLDAGDVTLHGSGGIAERIEAALQAYLASSTEGSAPRRVTRVHDSAWTGVAVNGARLMLSDGRTATELAELTRNAEIAVFDRPGLQPAAPAAPLAYAVAEPASTHWRAQAPAWLTALGFAPHAVADTPGLIVARTIAMLINEAADAVLQGVCTPAGADAAMKLGVNYPAGPFEWLEAWGARGVMQMLHALDAHYRGERYRVSPWLRRSLAAR
jgi:3-hydroxybutyryl-CoA dehydrogenase